MGQIKVEVVHGKRLVIRDFKSSDPYVLLKLGNQVFFLCILLLSYTPPSVIFFLMHLHHSFLLLLLSFISPPKNNNIFFFCFCVLFGFFHNSMGFEFLQTLPIFYLKQALHLGGLLHITLTIIHLPSEYSQHYYYIG